MPKKSWAPCLVLLVSQGVTAQTMPSAGSQLQQLPVIPSLPNTVPRVLVTPSATQLAETEQGVAFVAQQLNVLGAGVYTEDALLKVADFQPGQQINLKALYVMAEKITQHYRRHGFFVARAYLPAQEVKDGVVTIAVLEGHYGQVALNNTSRLDSQVPNNLLSGLNPGDVIAMAPLEERLLLLSDVPGVQVRSTLVPGVSVGLSDLIVEIKPGALISGSVDADNAGNRYTGENRIGMTLNLNNPTGHGDLATLRALTSGSGLRYGRVAYQTLVGRGRVGVAYSELAYELGHQFKAPNNNGHARITTLFGSYPLTRSRQTNLNAGMTLDSKKFQDHSIATDKRIEVATASLSGDHRDAWEGGGLSSYSLAWSRGHLDTRTPYVAPVAEPVYKAAPVVAQAPVPAPVILPTPLPAPMPTPVPKPWVKVKLAADSLFGFDQDTLQTDGKHALDKLLLELKDVNVERVQVTGHTDRLGSKAYNDKLSTRRAEAVRNYLVQVGGMPAGIVSAMGVGADQAESSTQDCKGLKASQALITCLRVDRRVGVDVLGSQQQR